MGVLDGEGKRVMWKLIKWRIHDFLLKEYILWDEIDEDEKGRGFSSMGNAKEWEHLKLSP
jgi:hypothetical protein